MVQLHRNNQFYDFLLRVCELTYRNLLVSEKTRHRGKFHGLRQDQQQMAVVFENFIRTFYRVHTDFLVGREDIYWHWMAADERAAGLLPKMQTDISLVSGTRKIIIDCKSRQKRRRKTLRGGKATVGPPVSDQRLHGYLREDKLTETCQMMLLYPTVDLPLSATFTHKGHTISIRTINLYQPWQLIHRDLLCARRMRAAATPVARLGPVQITPIYVRHRAESQRNLTLVTLWQ